jgi:hypothetical protein
MIKKCEKIFGKKICGSPAVLLEAKKVARAYADSGPRKKGESDEAWWNRVSKQRNLEFEGTEFFNPHDFEEVIKPIGGYNEFDSETTARILKKFKGIKAKIAREGSPAVYIKGDEKTLKQVADNFKGYADEVDIDRNKKVLRVWFD